MTTITTKFDTSQRVRHKYQRTHVGMIYGIDISISLKGQPSIRYNVMWDGRGMDYESMSDDVIELE